jgi:hypothetical protein
MYRSPAWRLSPPLGFGPDNRIKIEAFGRSLSAGTTLMVQAVSLHEVNYVISDLPVHMRRRQRFGKRVQAAGTP